MKKYFKSIWKTYIVDIITLILIVITGALAKVKVGNFFEKVGLLENELLQINPDMNASIVALNNAEAAVAELSTIVFGTYILIFILIPFIFYLYLTLSNTINFSFIRNKFKKRNFLTAFLIGLPFLLIFYLIEWQIIYGIYSFLSVGFSIVIILLLMLIIFLMAYTWFVFTVLIVKKKFKKENLKVWYMKSHYLLPNFLFFSFFYIVILSILGGLTIYYLSDALFGFNLFAVSLLLLILLGINQILRVIFYKNVK